MSCYEQEQGSYRLPKAEVRRIRDAIIDHRAKEMENLYAAAQLVKNSFNRAPMAIRKAMTRNTNSLDDVIGFVATYYALGRTEEYMQMAMINLFTSYREALDAHKKSNGFGTVYIDQVIRSKLASFHEVYDKVNRDQGFVSNDITRALVRQMANGQQSEISRLKAPQKKILNEFKIKKSEKEIKVGNTDCSITLHQDDTLVEWAVPEGNRSVESARATSWGRLFFKLIHEATWTPGTGGEIRYESEETQDDGFEPIIRDKLNIKVQQANKESCTGFRYSSLNQYI